MLPPSQSQLCQKNANTLTQILRSHRNSKFQYSSSSFCSVYWSHTKNPHQINKNHTKNPPNKQKNQKYKKKCTSELLAWNTAGCCPSARCQWLKAASLAGNSKGVWLGGRNTSTSSGVKDLKFWVPLKLQRFAEPSSLAQSLWILHPSSCSDVCLNKFL